ncbi:hypothetical protein FOL47_000419 [Perkinsus chesapeaki]|uniref:Uncharacterized protein n=1 Tax=Perkinsus chesapeaki TaxID=330153 RepID=A0A7J6MLX7_PERCH|nr:hypothetical protein FOL47_000419 [Perkinsus chesapeaki]
MSPYFIGALVLCGLQRMEAQRPPPPTGNYSSPVAEDCVEVWFDETVRLRVNCGLNIVFSDPLKVMEKNPNYFMLNDSEGYNKFAREVAEDCPRQLQKGDLTFYDHYSNKNLIKSQYQGGPIILSPGKCTFRM